MNSLIATMYKSLLLLCAIFLASFSTGNAQVSQRITLQDAIRIALENNYQIKRAENQIQQSKNEITVSYAQFAPNLNASLSFNRSEGQQFDQIQLVYDNIVMKNAGGGINGGIQIFSGLQRIYGLRTAETGLVSARENERRIRQSVIFNVATAYLQVVMDQELIAIAEKNLDLARKQLEQTNAQVEVGSRPLVDRYNQESAVANAELSLTQRQSSASNNELRLVRLLQIDPLASYDFVIPDLEEENVTVENYDLRGMIDQAMQNRADVRAQEAQIRLSYYNMRSAMSSALPSLSASFGLRTSWSDRFRDPINRDQVMSFGKQFFDVQVGNSLGLNLSIPIFNRLNTWRSVQNGRINYKNAQLDMENVEFTVIQEVAQAYTDYYNYAKELESTEKALQAAERAFQTEQERYNVGASTLIEFTNANNSYIQAASNRTQALFRFIFQEQLIKYYQGQIDENVQIDALKN